MQSAPALRGGIKFAFLSRMALSIKKWISLRCKIALEDDAEKGAPKPLIIELGEAQIKNIFSPAQLTMIKETLIASGYLTGELLLADNQKTELADKIKNIIIELIQGSELFPATKFSYFISKRLNYSYNYLTTIFAEIKGTTIEHFIILHKIEKVKELIIYSNLSLGQIATRMQYSSVSHLSNQFKKTTGLTPSQYKKLKQTSKNAA